MQDTPLYIIYLQGKLLQGRLHVSRHHPRDEAEVLISTDERGSEERRVTILGTMCRNRAIHNDQVAIRLIPSSQSQESESGGPINIS